MLHVTLSVKHGIRDENLERLFERVREKLVERLHGENLEQVSLHCEVELSTHRREGSARLTLDLPGGALHAESKGRSHLQALRHATDALLSELSGRRRKQRDRDRHADSIRPVNGRSITELSQASEIARPGLEPMVADRIAKTLPELQSFVQREIALHAPLGEVHSSSPIEVDDVVDEALLNALATYASCPDDVPFDRYVFSCAFDVILAEIERRRTERRADSLEDDLKTPNPEAALDALYVLDSLRGVEDMASAWADESGTDAIAQRAGVSLGDSLADDRARAGDVELVGRDLRYAVMRAIRHLPGDERRALSLVALEGLPPGEAAKRMHRSESEITTLMEQARVDVRRELLSHGY